MTSARGRRGLLTRWELAVGALLALAVAAIVLPIGRRLRLESLRSEVPMVIEGLQHAAVDHHLATGTWVGRTWAPQRPDVVGTHRVPWAPEGVAMRTDAVRGAYQVLATPDGVHIVGTCDVDGDGQRARFVAGERGEIVRQTPDDVY